MHKSILFLITSFLMIGISQSHAQEEWHGISTTSGKAVIGHPTLHENSKVYIRDTDHRVGLRIHNIFNNTDVGGKFGIHSFLAGSDNTSQYGINSVIGTNGIGTKIGIRSVITSINDGNKYGIYTEVNSNGTGKRYGLYSKVSGLENRAGYFEGNTEVKGNFITGGSKGKFIFTHAWQNNEDFLTIAPNTSGLNNDWNWFRALTFLDDGELKKGIDGPDKTAFSINVNDGANFSTVATTFRVLGDGRTVIGRNDDNTDLATPAGYKLYVKDGILTEKVKVAFHNDPSNWADYVFNNDYKLMPLNQLKTYIDENKHLPNIPSSQDLIDNGGVELMEMTKLQMEKIEELTLYMLQMNEEVQRLKQENKELKAQIQLIKE